MLRPGDVLSHLEMSVEEGVPLQRGMNYRLNQRYSVLLMSVRPDAPYRDRLEDAGRTLIYEGHDERKTSAAEPKHADQPLKHTGGSLTQNGLFHQAALGFKAGERPAELVRVYEKLHTGVWVYNGMFRLTDSWVEWDGRRNVIRFRLELQESEISDASPEAPDHDRVIPSSVKLEVWKRDGGRCRMCGSTTNLHFDHIIPYSKGGTSLMAENVQILCATHNLRKRDRIE